MHSVRCISLNQISLPQSLKKINEWMEQVSLPPLLTEIGDNAFEKCTSLKEVSIPSSVTEIGYYSFSGCISLTKISLPSSLTFIGEYSFEGCSSLRQIIVPSNIDIDIDGIGLDSNVEVKLI